MFFSPNIFINPNKPDMTHVGSVEEWLTSIKMEKYLEHLLRAGFTTIERVAHLNEHDLDCLGVTLIGHRKKILQSVQALRAHTFPVYNHNGDASRTPSSPAPASVHVPQAPPPPSRQQISDSAFIV